MTRLVVLWPTLLVVAAVLTLVTTLVGSSAGGYGFPFAWRIGGCPPPGIEISASCLLAIGSDWLSFGFDVLFYTLVGYGLLSPMRSIMRENELLDKSRYEKYQSDRVSCRPVDL